MSETRYGENKPSYDLVEKPDGRIEIRVYHDNEGIRRKIRENMANASYFLKWADFSGSNPRAKYYLAQIVRAYRSQFASNRVDFVLQ